MPFAAIVGGALIGGYFANEAAGESSDASRYGTDQTTAEQRRQFNLTREDQQPYREAGVNALSRLQGGIADQGQPLPAYREAPIYNAFSPGQSPDQYTAAPAFAFDQYQPENSPGYQFRLNQGTEAVNRGAAKSGNLNSGARLLALQNFGQRLASEEYANEYARQFRANQDAFNRNVAGYGLNYQRNQDLYNRGVNEYGLGQQRNQDIYNRGLNTFNIQNQQNQDLYGRGQNVLNRYASLAGLGQTSLSQTGAAGQNMANQLSGAYQQNALNQAQAANTRYTGLNNAVQGGIQNYMLDNYINQLNTGYNALSANDRWEI